VLTGHTDNAEFALCVSDVAPLAASGGKDTRVRAWEGGPAAKSLVMVNARQHPQCILHPTCPGLPMMSITLLHTLNWGFDPPARCRQNLADFSAGFPGTRVLASTRALHLTLLHPWLLMAFLLHTLRQGLHAPVLC
jgi:hypothetical protein